MTNAVSPVVSTLADPTLFFHTLTELSDRIGVPIIFSPLVDSTQDEAKRAIDGGLSHPLIIWANAQRKGRGRFARTWSSEPGNLYVSFILPALAPAKQPLLTYAASLATYETLKPYIAALHIKWPNDVLSQGKKISGILIETHTNPITGQPWIVIGIGINVLHTPILARGTAAAVHESGHNLLRTDILAQLHTHLMTMYTTLKNHDTQMILDAWQAVSFHKPGETIRVSTDNDTFELGFYEGLNAQGALLFRDHLGQIHTTWSGDVEHGAPTSQDHGARIA